MDSVFYVSKVKYFVFNISQVGVTLPFGRHIKPEMCLLSSLYLVASKRYLFITNHEVSASQS